MFPYLWLSKYRPVVENLVIQWSDIGDTLLGDHVSFDPWIGRRFSCTWFHSAIDWLISEGKFWLKTFAALRLYPIMGKTVAVNPDDKSGAGVLKTFPCYVLRPGYSCDDAGSKLYWTLHFPWTTSVSWRRQTCWMSNRKSLIKNLPSPVPRRGQSSVTSLISD